MFILLPPSLSLEEENKMMTQPLQFTSGACCDLYQAMKVFSFCNPLALQNPALGSCASKELYNTSSHHSAEEKLLMRNIC